MTILTQRTLLVVGTTPLPADRGRFYVGNGGAIARQSLPTDPVGNFTLTLQNVVVGSAIRIEAQSTGATLWTGTAAASTVVVPLFAYASGSPLNDLRIKVRKGSGSPFYRPFETLTTATVGAASVFVAQIEDD
ncbi:hypothetical protein UFOVP707_55 [uncultured Caudovirales phage]|uniref:Uncharacterized protein n=1 Tax=uncultured Caudovirales phage TaxID=2100421 RepID=A0A6J5NP30_9CAUD|nr:hypothetical protein UFOVP707_55 [uncultured Caudovirales phage]